MRRSRQLSQVDLSNLAVLCAEALITWRKVYRIPQVLQSPISKYKGNITRLASALCDSCAFCGKAEDAPDCVLQHGRRSKLMQLLAWGQTGRFPVMMLQTVCRGAAWSCSMLAWGHDGA